MTFQTTAEALQAVSCVTCKAGPGEPCRSTSGKIASVTHLFRRQDAAKASAAPTFEPDPEDLCRLCVLPATEAVQMKPDGWKWANERRPFPVDLQVCGGCSSWLASKGWVVTSRALDPKALR